MALFSKDAAPPPAETKTETAVTPGVSVIGAGIFMDGKITGKQNLVIEGQMKGEIDLSSDLRIAAAAQIEATIHAQNVTVEGSVAGDISADKKIELLASARVDGNIRAPKIVVAEGARFRGAVDMGAQKPKEQ